MRHLATAAAAALLWVFSPTPAAAQLPTINVKSYGATGSGSGDDAPAIQNAFNAAAQLSAQTHGRVEVFLPAGRYAIASFTPVIPSNIVLSGDTAGPTTILNRLPAYWQPFVMGTKDSSAQFSYLAIARADDTTHPAVPNNSYQGLNYVYLHDPNDIAGLAALGVPSTVQPSYAGLPIELATGATLGNNGNTAGGPCGSDPKAQLVNDNGINPTPAVLSRILAVDSSGKVTLNQANRFDWGRYAHNGGESLADYYGPSCTHASNTFVSGPGWIVPANNFHHDIDIQHLIFEGDLSQTNLLNGIYGLYIAYSINVAVRDCTFQKLPGYYPILSIRAFNTLFERNTFMTTSFGAVTLDAGSGWTFSANTFRGYPNPNAGNPNQNPGPTFFIGFDEAPIDITVIGNTFTDLPYLSGVGNQVLMGGNGGSYSRVTNNTFTRTGPPVEEAYGSSQILFDSNTLVNAGSPLIPGSGSAAVSAYNNRYIGQTAAGWTNNVDFYDQPGGPISYFALNHGVLPQEFSYPQGTQYSNVLMAANTDFHGLFVWATHVLVFVPGGNGAWNFSYDWYAASRGVLSNVRIRSITAAKPSFRVGQTNDLTITLTAPADQNYPLYLIATAGELDAVGLHSFIITVPAGQSSVTLPAELTGLKAGQVTLSARTLFTTSPFTAATTVLVQ